MEKMKHTRKINLKHAGVLEIECSEKLYEAVRSHYNLRLDEEITDHTLKEFVTTMCKNAIENAEEDLAKDL
jgi:hypothetical protein